MDESLEGALPSQPIMPFVLPYLRDETVFQFEGHHMAIHSVVGAMDSARSNDIHLQL